MNGDYKKIKLIATDIDGTLVNSKGKISSKTKEILLQWQKQGGKIALVSGRNYTDCLPLIEDLNLANYGGYIIGANGQFIQNCTTQARFEEKKLSIEQCLQIIDSAKSMQLVSVLGFDNKLYNVGTGFSLFVSKVYSIARKVQWIYRQVDGYPQTNTTDIRPYLTEGLGKIGFFSRYKKLLKFEKFLHQSHPNQFDTYFVAKNWLEVTKKGTSKGNALFKLCEIEELSIDETLAFGDGGNDISLLEAAGIGVAMGNGMSQLKEKADFICDTNKNEGLAKFVEQNLL